jgi:hypothetical protein
MPTAEIGLWYAGRSRLDDRFAAAFRVCAMNRFQHFYANAGFSGVARSVIVLVAASFLLAMAITEGRGYYAAVASAAGIVLSYLLAEFLTDHMRATKYVMNAVALGYVASLWFVPNFREIEAVRVCTAPLAFTYIGCYFWTHSHPLVFAQHRIDEMQPYLDDIDAAVEELDTEVARLEAAEGRDRRTI